MNALGQERGVDVSLTLDLVHAIYNRPAQAAFLVSQNWYYRLAACLIKEVAQSAEQ